MRGGVARRVSIGCVGSGAASRLPGPWLTAIASLSRSSMMVTSVPLPLAGVVSPMGTPITPITMTIALPVSTIASAISPVVALPVPALPVARPRGLIIAPPAQTAGGEAWLSAGGIGPTLSLATGRLHLLLLARMAWPLSSFTKLTIGSSCGVGGRRRCCMWWRGLRGRFPRSGLLYPPLLEGCHVTMEFVCGSGRGCTLASTAGKGTRLSKRLLALGASLHVAGRYERELALSWGRAL